MKKIASWLLVVTVAALVFAGAAALAQLRITSFNEDGELAWTNSIYRGFYCVEQGSSPTGPWTRVATVADLDWPITNQMVFQVSTGSTQAFHRVSWIHPDPIGVWDFEGYFWDMLGGELAITGQLNITSMTLISTNPIGYRLDGTQTCQYVGAESNAFNSFGFFGTGPLSGQLELRTAGFSVSWPTNVIDALLAFSGALGPDSLQNGRWLYHSLRPRGGRLYMVRTPSTNLMSSHVHTNQ